MSRVMQRYLQRDGAVNVSHGQLMRLGTEREIQRQLGTKCPTPRRARIQFIIIRNIFVFLGHGGAKENQKKRALFFFLCKRAIRIVI